MFPYTQEDNRVFPKSNNSQSIINCLFKETNRLSIYLELGTKIEKIEKVKESFKLYFKNKEPQKFHKVIVATGGSPKREGLVG